MAPFPKYAFENDLVLAFHEDTLIAQGKDFAKVAATADQYFEELRSTKHQNEQVAARKSATHVTTPNGVKGTLLSSVPTIWDEDMITVRMQNGEVRHFVTARSNDTLTYSNESPAPPRSYSEYFQQKLADSDFTKDIPGLTSRLNVLKDVRNEASHLIARVAHTEQQALHQVILSAEAEGHEINEALEHLHAVDAEAMQPPAPFEMQAVEQASLGRAANDNWLDVVASTMIAESETEDFDQLLAEGPTTFTSSLETAALGNAGTTREMAMAHIHGKTAGFQGEAVENYRDKFVAAVEMARRQELTYRQDHKAQKIEKETKMAQTIPDEALFM